MRVKKESTLKKCFNVFNTLLMILVIVIMVFPYLHILAKALNDGADTARGGIILLPRIFTMENFGAVVNDSAFPRAAIVSVVRTIVGTILAVTVQFMAAYAFTHKDLIGRNGLLLFLMIPMYFGGGLLPTYIFYVNIGMINNYLVYVLPTCFSLYNMIIIRSYMNTIPKSLMESAKLEGANELTVLTKIVAPLSKPIMATIALWTAVGLWSDWTTTMYYVTKKNMFTLQYVLVQVLKETEKIQKMIDEALMRGEVFNVAASAVTTESIRSAQIIITTLPIVIVYPFLQKYFIQGVTLGAVKD